MMKNVFLILMLLLSNSNLWSQQLNLNTQYMFNEFLWNPGATGSKDKYIPVQANFRKQWVGFPGSPTTQSVSCHGEVQKNFGFGGNVFNDNSGPSRRTGVNINGAYHMRFSNSKSKFLGFGLGVSLSQHTIDEEQLRTYLPDDPAVVQGFNNQLVPDVNFGVFYQWKENAYVGLSAYNLAQTKRDLYMFDDAIGNPLVRNYYLIAGYDIETQGKLTYKLTGLVQAIETGTTQFDVNAIAVYENTGWFGLGYRHLDAISALAGIQIGQIKIGYSYDYTISAIGNYSSGSHEVFLELQLYNKPGSSNKRNWWKRNLRYAPKI